VPLPRVLRTTSFRFAAIYVLMFVASAMVLGTVVFVVAREAMLQQMTARIETEAALLESHFKREGLPGLAATVEDRGRGAAALEYLLEGPDGRRLAGEIPSVGKHAGWFDITIDERQGDKNAPERLRALAVLLSGGFLLVVGDDIGRLDELQEAILRAFAVAIGVTVLLGALGGLLLSRAFLHRVDEITRTAEAIINGNLARRVPLGGTGDDFDHLAATLNRMLDRIAALMESLKQVSSDIAHDLRTPLSRLLQRLEEARESARNVQEYEDTMESAAKEGHKILETFSAILRIAQVEGGERGANFTDVNLTLIAEAVADAFLPVMEDEGHSLEVLIEPAAMVRGDKELLSQLLVNLMENALRHTPAGTRIVLSLLRSPDGRLELSVKDNGPGVPDSERGHLVERFYRCERSRTSEGNGLGLSLVAAVVDLHGATMRLEDAGPGLLVSILFQASPPGVRQGASQGFGSAVARD
jgi:signal transduction histidine kinase